MLNRVTTQMMAASSQRSLESAQAKLAEVQDRALTLKNINRPSDDPAGAAQAIALRGQLNAASQYGTNISDGNGWLAAADTALGQATNILNRVRDLVVQAANGTLSDSARQAIAVEIEGLGEDLLTQANTQYLGRHVFAGSSDTDGAFTNTVPPVFNGVSGSSVERRVDASRTVRVDSDGGAIFGTGAGSAFAVVGDIVADIRAGINPNGRLAAIGGRIQAVIDGRADVGMRQTRLGQAQNSLEGMKATLETQRSRVEDLDLGRAVMDLKVQETNYQVALAVTAKVLQPTLMDFLR
ncbi:flagellar hook-associated protein FlgL [Paenarthrobacter ureafaciens]|uniref:flagellar hook-associated protein FlgL n=1 Tax=Paenarthrobacter ureafaciens TaxID=37931 RepID=UPI0019170D05|nr:flagellar hook-associated protein FlgL [Paenarthrobacter ureafaciens]QQQ63042.1 flagellar hook-associated protein FlgL [Paenarthrobacter ureafaciens]